MLWPGGKPSGVDLPLGLIFMISAYLVPALSIGQIIVPKLTKLYLYSMLPFALLMLGITVGGMMGLL